MSLLHDYFHTRNLQLFQRLLLETSSASSSSADKSHTQLSTSAGKSSYKKHGVLGNVEVNGKDWLGRTALHLAAASIEHLDYVRALLKHPAINVNVLDEESHWTPLHRAMYNANIPAARLLLQRSDIDVTITDNEGYTAFDVYNSTLVGTKPAEEESESYAELYTWGTNVNAALGLGDSNDRVCPEHVSLQPKEDEEDLEGKNLAVRFQPVKVKDVVMSKLHTVVITSESGGNLRVCGFGSGGRLGPYSHTQYTFKPLTQLSQTIISVALGQDHTLALTKAGEVLSWGLNRFSQLGYLVELPANGRGTEEPIQYTPRKIQNSLRKEIVKGVAASKVASACWTDDSVYTWGTNFGQLGYDKVAQPVQVFPRKVSRLTMPVISIAMTDNAMACLMQNRQVECFYNDGHHRINFPTHAFPSPIRPYRPPQAHKDSRMAKITSCGDLFASLSYHGEVFIFSPSATSSTNTTSNNIATSTSYTIQESESSTPRPGGPFKCQRVWALRKKSSAVKDVAIGADGSIIICTVSGHVYVRTRNPTKLNPSSASLSTLSSTPSGSGPGTTSSASQKAFKFHRIPFLQRVVKVCANATGAFGALRVEVPIKEIEVKGDMVGVELGRVAPWLGVGRDLEDEVEDVFGWRTHAVASIADDGGATGHKRRGGAGADSDNEDAEGEMEDDAVEGDIRVLKEICDAIKREERVRLMEPGTSVPAPASRSINEEEGEQPNEEGKQLDERSPQAQHESDIPVTLAGPDVSAATGHVDEEVEQLDDKIQQTPHGSDMLVICEKTDCYPLHLTSLRLPPIRNQGSRFPPFLPSPFRRHVLPLQTLIHPPNPSPVFSSPHLTPSQLLIILTYLYSDNVLTIWDRRIASVIVPYFHQQFQQQPRVKEDKLKWDVGQVRNEVVGLARVLELRDVLGVLERPVKVTLAPSIQRSGGIVKDLGRLFDRVNIGSEKSREAEVELEGKDDDAEGGEGEENVEAQVALRPDVILELEDREVRTHSVILRSRSDLFKSFFDEPDWTRDRWAVDESGEGGGLVVRVNLRHLKWRVMEFVLKFMCCGCDRELFEKLKFVKNVDELVEFMFEVMAAANELLLDRLVLLCSSVILTWSSFHNACSILSDSTHFSCIPLINKIQYYITSNMELFLQSHMLDELPIELVYQLARYAQEKQKEKAPFVNGGKLLDEVMIRWCDWLDDTDVPVPFVRSWRVWREKTKSLPIPKFERKVDAVGEKEKGLRKPPSADDLFVMDDTEGPTLLHDPAQSAAASAGPAWKVYVAPKVDMKAVMAEAAQGQLKTNTNISDPSRTPGSNITWRTPGSRPEYETPKAQSTGPSSSQPSTPQKSRPIPSGSGSGSQGRIPSLGKLPRNVVTTPTKQTPGSSVSTPGAAPSGPVMGPTITPMRMPAGGSKANGGQRNVSGSSKAWASPRPIDTLTPIVPAAQNTFRASAEGTTSSTSSTTVNTNDNTNHRSISFLDIQHSQKEEQLFLGDLQKDKRSLLEIQEEEAARKEEEAARKEEENFLRWWQEEEARVKREMEVLEGFKRGSSTGGGAGAGGKRKGSGSGRGRGSGGGERGERGDGAERGERGERRGGGGAGGRGGPKARKEGKQMKQANVTTLEGQSLAGPSFIAGSSTTPTPKNLRPPQQRKPSQKNQQHHQPRAPDQQQQT
ncbi:hypothetical protein NP233_g344 [Leucocoprinus birnbaumii]|uniref:BTB domain-containing protein n=1 Tax=Leucocoprinus birnbaumii TaxID=56174 RepID=A0AAD5Z0C8_9AGAR|nr:hypothetical protein NP233_g344 [Leucocoprinus birnbaumii]